MSGAAGRPLKVLQVFGRMERGGAEICAVRIMRHLDRSRIRSDICVLSGKAGSLDAEVEAAGGKVHHLGLGPLFPLRFLSLLKREEYDVVHSHVHTFSGAVLALARIAGVGRRIAHFHSTDDGRGAGTARRLQRGVMKALIDSCAHCVVGVCEGVLDSAWGQKWRRDPRFAVVYNGMDLERFKGAPDREEVRSELGLAEGPVYIHIGRFDPPKNHRRLVEIFAALSRRTPGSRLLLVGRGGNDLEDEARSRADELGVSDSIVFAGERDDVPRLLRAADLLIFPSLWEGLPGVVLEALAAGLPVLASDLPGVLEIAERTSGVTPLSLARSDQEWAAAAEDILETRTETLLEPGSPFDVAVSAERMAAIWEGSGTTWRK